MSKQQEAISLPEEFYRTLVQVLSSENESLQKFVNNLDSQYHVLINQKLTDFVSILKDQKRLLAESQEAEKQKYQKIKTFLPGSNKYSLHELIMASPPDYRDKLIELKENFDFSLEKIQKKRDRNKLLIQKSLDMIQSQIKYLRIMTQPGYDANGNREATDISYINKQI